MNPSNLTEGIFQDKRQLDQNLEELLYPRGGQPDRGFFSDEEKQESTRIEGSAPEGATISNLASEISISPKVMVILKWSYDINGPIFTVEIPMYGGLYKKDHGSIVPWSGSGPYSETNCFT